MAIFGMQKRRIFGQRCLGARQWGQHFVVHDDKRCGQAGQLAAVSRNGTQHIADVARFFSDGDKSSASPDKSDLGSADRGHLLRRRRRERPATTVRH